MSKEDKPIFQQKALDKLRSHEDLNQVFTVVRPIGWLTVIAIALIIFSGGIWAVFGIMADKVTGYGIIVDPGGVANIAHTSGGRIVELNVEVGQRVTKGQVVATIDQPSIEQNVLVQQEQSAGDRSNIDIGNHAAQIGSLKEQLHRESKVISAYDGVLVGRRVNMGDVVSVGAPLYSVRLDGKRGDMLAVMYVPASQGSKIKPGMTMQVSPGAVDSQQYGSLVGRVYYVSEFPMASSNISVWTGNSELANWFIQQNGGAVVEVLVVLIKDDNTPSGYLWTSVLGSEETIKPGMSCTGTAIVKRNAPITKVFQNFSQWIRSD